MQYDDEAALAAIKKHEEFPDAFGNIYKPVTTDESSFINPTGKDIKGYNVVDGATGEIIIGDDKKPIFVGIDEATRNAYGKTEAKSR